MKLELLNGCANAILIKRTQCLTAWRKLELYVQEMLLNNGTSPTLKSISTKEDIRPKSSTRGR